MISTRYAESLKTARIKDVARYPHSVTTTRPTHAQGDGSGTSETETSGTTNETSATSDTNASGMSETSSGCRRRRRIAPFSSLTLQCRWTLTPLHTHPACPAQTGWRKFLSDSMRAIMSHDQGQRTSESQPDASRADKSCIAAEIVTESDQAAFASNQTDSTPDVTCTTDPATHEEDRLCV